MAPKGGGGFGDRNKDGISDDFDGVPGNSSDSKSYARIYDPLGQQEVSNLPEPANYREAQRIITAAARFNKDMELGDDEILGDAQSRVHLFPSVGKFIVPLENTWSSHAHMVKDPDYALEFNPNRFVYFDKIIAEKLNIPALTDPTHRDYAKYEGLRTNLAVMRNDIIGMYLDDGSFDPGDEKFIPVFVSIAEALGESLANDKWALRPFTQHMSMDVANVEGVGAREMYKHLLEMQSPASSLRNLLSQVPLLEVTNRNWGLKPLEETPYSSENLAAPLPQPKISLTVDELAAYCANMHLSPGQSTAAYTELALDNAVALNALDSLTKPVREESIEEARVILRWLKNLKFGDRDMAEWLDQGTPAEQLAKAESIARLTEIYALQLAHANHLDPYITEALSVQEANGAAGALAIGLSEHGLQGLPEHHPSVLHLLERARYVPKNWTAFENVSVAVLLDTIDEGLEYTSRRTLDPEVAAHRLLDIGNQVERNARKLRSVDSMEPPTREESVELAREILRRLREMKFSDVTSEEILSVGRPEEKAAFARNVASLSEIYTNLLQQAAQGNPQIFNDPAIQDANDAVGSFSHSVKLMAAKEMPGSLAATQQISADITQMPEEWKKLHGHTVERLLSNMEEGLNRAVEEVELQAQQAQDQDEELAQQAAESSLIQDHHHRKRRRRKRFASGGLTKSAKRRNAGDLNGDGVADHLQSLNLRGNAITTQADGSGSNSNRRLKSHDLNNNGIPDHLEHAQARKDPVIAPPATLFSDGDSGSSNTVRRQKHNDVNGNGIPDDLELTQTQRRNRQVDLTAAAAAVLAGAGLAKSNDVNKDGIPDHMQHGPALTKGDMDAVRKLGSDLRNLSAQAAQLAEKMDPSAVVMSPDDRNFSMRDKEQRNHPSKPQRQ